MNSSAITAGAGIFIFAKFAAPGAWRDLRYANMKGPRLTARSPNCRLKRTDDWAWRNRERMRWHCYGRRRVAECIAQKVDLGRSSPTRPNRSFRGPLSGPSGDTRTGLQQRKHIAERIHSLDDP